MPVAAEDFRHDPTPELAGDYTRRDLIAVLEDLRFGRPGSLTTIKIDAHVRDFILTALRGH